MSDLTINAELIERLFGRKINWSKTRWTAAEGAILRWRAVEELGGWAVVDEDDNIIASFITDTDSDVDPHTAARLLAAAPKLVQLCKRAAETTDDLELRDRINTTIRDL